MRVQEDRQRRRGRSHPLAGGRIYSDIAQNLWILKGCHAAVWITPHARPHALPKLTVRETLRIELDYTNPRAARNLLACPRRLLRGPSASSSLTTTASSPNR